MQKFHTVIRVVHGQQQGQVVWDRQEDVNYKSASYFEWLYSDTALNKTATVVNQFTTFE